MTERTQQPASVADREIVMSRVFEAYRERVYKAWTEPDEVALWWGPNGFTNTIQEMNVTPGGVCRFIMHGPGGVDYPNKTVFVDVEEPERLVYDHGDDVDFPQFRVTVTLAEENDKTRVTMQLLFPSVEACERTKQFGAVEGGNQTLNRLAKHLKTEA